MSHFEVVIPTFLDAVGQRLEPLDAIGPTPEEATDQADQPDRTRNQGGDAARGELQAAPLAIKTTSSAPTENPTGAIKRWATPEQAHAELLGLVRSFPNFLARADTSVRTQSNYSSIAKQLVEALIKKPTKMSVADAVTARVGQYGLHTQAIAQTVWHRFNDHVFEQLGHRFATAPRCKATVGGSAARRQHPLAGHWAVVASCLSDVPLRPRLKRVRYDVLELAWGNPAFGEDRVLSGRVFDFAFKLPGVESDPALVVFQASLRRLLDAAWSVGQTAPPTAPVFVADRASRLVRADANLVRAAWVMEKYVSADIVGGVDVFHIGWNRDVHPKLLSDALAEKRRPEREVAAKRAAAEARRPQLLAELQNAEALLKCLVEEVKPNLPEAQLAQVDHDIERESAAVAKLRAELGAL